MKQKVFINGRFLTQRVTGVQRYAREALLSLDRRWASGQETRDFDLKVLAPPGTQSPPLEAIPFEATGRLTGNAWEQSELPWRARGGYLFSFSATGPLLFPRQLVTVHDASVFAVPQAFSATFRAWYSVLLRAFALRHPMLLTVSHFSKKELAHRLRVPESKFRVTTEGYQHLQRVSADTTILAKSGLQKHKYVLAVSSLTPNKNFGLIVDAVKRLGDPDFCVAIAGGQDKGVFGQSCVPDMPFVKMLGYVTDAELRALYENAGLFLYPSLYEGFGIPALEAMASGCPVIASDSASVPEVCGDAVEYVSPRDADTLAKKIVLFMSQPERRRELAERGSARVREFSWDECARLNLSYLRERLGLDQPHSLGT